MDPESHDALIVVDVQNDFLPGGALGVPDGDAVIPVLNGYIEEFAAKGNPIFATRDWHPSNHCSFAAQGGPWPPHCVAETDGAQLAATLQLPDEVTIVDKATTVEKDAYSGFSGTDLSRQLKAADIRRLVIGGLATDYCVKQTVLDALAEGFEVLVPKAAIRAVNVSPEDGEKAILEMTRHGAVLVD